MSGMRCAMIRRVMGAVLLTGLAIAGAAWGADAVGREELARESEAACQASSGTKATPEMVVKMVHKACAEIEQDGKAAFRKFQGKDSEFLFAGTYIWVNDMSGVMLMHPIKHKMNGIDTLDIKDANGKRLFVDFIEVCRSSGSGWVDYLWPKPGKKFPEQKVSFVKRARCDGEDVVVGCGIYDVPPDEIRRLVEQQDGLE